jgi:hypothetical protein
MYIDKIIALSSKGSELANKWLGSHIAHLSHMGPYLKIFPNKPGRIWSLFVALSIHSDHDFYKLESAPC